MLKKISKLLFIAFFFSFKSAIAAEWLLDKNCEPKGLSAKLQLFNNSHKFWNSQLKELESMEESLERYRRITPAELDIRASNIENKIVEKYLANLKQGFPDNLAREMAMTWGQTEASAIRQEVEIYRTIVNEQPKYHEKCRQIINLKKRRN
jgi:hypothetical protein